MIRNERKFGPSYNESQSYKILKAIGSKMHVCHGAKDPHHRIFSGLFEAVPGACLALVGDSIKFHAVVCQIPLFLSQPPRCKWEIWEQEKPNDGNDERDSALQDKEPLPASETAGTVHAVKDARRDKPRKGSSQDITRVENSNARSNFLARVEDGEKVDSTRVVGGLGDAKEKAREKKTDVVF